MRRGASVAPMMTEPPPFLLRDFATLSNRADLLSDGDGA
jgi:hypothetical protein